MPSALSPIYGDAPFGTALISYRRPSQRGSLLRSPFFTMRATAKIVIAEIERDPFPTMATCSPVNCECFGRVAGYRDQKTMSLSVSFTLCQHSHI